MNGPGDERSEGRTRESDDRARHASNVESFRDLMEAAKQSGVVVVIRGDGEELNVYPEEPRARRPYTVETPTPGELEVLHLVAEGLRNVEIAERLGIRPTTVQFHLSNLFEKLHVHSRTELAHRAREVRWTS